MRFRDKLAVALARAVIRVAPWVARAIEAPPVPVLAHGPRFALALAVAGACWFGMSAATGMSLDPVANMREVATIMQKGRTP